MVISRINQRKNNNLKFLRDFVGHILVSFVLSHFLFVVSAKNMTIGSQKLLKAKKTSH